MAGRLLLFCLDEACNLAISSFAAWQPLHRFWLGGGTRSSEQCWVSWFVLARVWMVAVASGRVTPSVFGGGHAPHLSKSRGGPDPNSVSADVTLTQWQPSTNPGLWPNVLALDCTNPGACLARAEYTASYCAKTTHLATGINIDLQALPIWHWAVWRQIDLQARAI